MKYIPDLAKAMQETLCTSKVKRVHLVAVATGVLEVQVHVIDGESVVDISFIE